MARFHGKVGYGVTVEESPGVFKDNIIEYAYFGDVLQNTRNVAEGDNLNKDISVGARISIIADPYAREKILAIRYVDWMGVLWTVTQVEVQIPRLILILGEVYHGPTPAAP